MAAFSDDLASDFRLAVPVAVELGLDGLEIRNVWGRNVKELEPSEVEDIRSLADDAGLAISAISSPYGRDFYIEDDNAQRDAERVVAKMIQFAEVLGTPYIRIFALWKPDHTNHLARPPHPDCLDPLVERLMPSIELAEAAGVTLVVETEGDSYVGQVAEARQLIDRVGSKALRLCWDIVNGWRSGEQPWPDGFDHTAGVLSHVHVKDRTPDASDPSKAGDSAIVGQGAIPYAEILPALKKSGYSGFCTVERHYHPRKPEDEPLLREQVVADIHGFRGLLERYGA